MSSLRRCLLPGFAFQSVVIAGAYGTGQELVEFFLSRGPMGALLAMGVTTVVWSAVCVASYEFARVFRAFEYRSFFKILLGRFWIVFEALYMVLLVLVLAVVAAAAGAMLQQGFGLPRLAGAAAIMVAVGLLVLGGNERIEKAFSAWSGVLYVVYGVFFVWCAARFGPAIGASVRSGVVEGAWVKSGIAYAGYNLGVLPAVMATLRHLRSRRESVAAGLLTGPLAILPGVLFVLAAAGEYPAIASREAPVNHMLELLGSPAFTIVFQAMLFGTLAETGAGLVHAVNERVARATRERGAALPRWRRAALAAGLLTVATLIAQAGLIPLIARGYGTITWGFVAVFVAPTLTWGVWLIVRARRAPADRALTASRSAAQRQARGREGRAGRAEAARLRQAESQPAEAPREGNPARGRWDRRSAK